MVDRPVEGPPSKADNCPVPAHPPAVPATAVDADRPTAQPAGPPRSGASAWLRNLLPTGNQLDPPVWERRHRAIVTVALVQSVLVFAFGVYRSVGVLHALAEGLAVAVLAVGARAHTGGKTVRAGLATLSVITASGMLVHQAAGVTEWHFHFFVMVGLITLYQDWTPFLVAVAFVVLHHGVLGTLDPEGVYGTPEAIRAPWRWALLHATFVLAASAVHIAAWRLSEAERNTDPVTGLPNRLGFSDIVDGQLERDRDGVAVLYLDLDGFKNVNDSLGHDAGDEVLRRLAAAVRDAVRPGDRVARLGGDEFGVMLVGVDLAAATAVADRVLRSVAQPVHLPLRHRDVRLAASIGVAMAGAGLGGTDLLRHADIAMSSAKGCGGGRWAVFDDRVEETQREWSELAEDLRHAVERRQLRVVYQPTVRLSDQHVTGVEALLRWDHPTRGPVSPAVFIPIAEDTDEILAIGDWMIEAAIAQVATWQRQGLDISLAVNLSARQLNDPGLPDRVLAHLAAHAVRADRLVVELTESSLVVDLDDAGQRLAELRRHGVRVAIDDFGTGYSSMSYLRGLPVDVVKVDRSFVQAMASGPSAVAVVRSIVELARALELGVVAEGVERPDQARMVESLGCGTGQGYLWSPPVAPEAIPDLVARRALQDAAAGS
jgi:diguanylate cyclase (GGDEF)-like protein